MASAAPWHAEAAASAACLAVHEAAAIAEEQDTGPTLAALLLISVLRSSSRSWFDSLSLGRSWLARARCRSAASSAACAAILTTSTTPAARAEEAKEPSSELLESRCALLRRVVEAA